MIYETDNIRLRPWTEKDMDMDNYKSWFNDFEVIKFTSHCRFPLRNKDREYVINSMENGNLWWAIEHRTVEHCRDNKPYTYNYWLVGNIVLIDIDLLNRKAELAIMIGDKDFWKKGIGYEACRFVLSHSFDKLGLNKVYLATPGVNVGMRKLAEKIGMTPTGKRRNDIYLNGCFHDVIEYDMLRSQYYDSSNRDCGCSSKLGNHSE